MTKISLYSALFLFFLGLVCNSAEIPEESRVSKISANPSMFRAKTLGRVKPLDTSKFSRDVTAICKDIDGICLHKNLNCFDHFTEVTGDLVKGLEKDFLESRYQKTSAKSGFLRRLRSVKREFIFENGISGDFEKSMWYFDHSVFKDIGRAPFSDSGKRQMPF